MGQEPRTITSKETKRGTREKGGKERVEKGGKLECKTEIKEDTEITIPGPLLEASAASRQNELWPVLLGEQSSPRMFALSSQFSKLHQIIELLVHILRATHQL